MATNVAAPLLARHASDDSSLTPNAEYSLTAGAAYPRTLFDRGKAALILGLLGCSLLLAYLGISSPTGKPSFPELLPGADCYTYTGKTCFFSSGCSEDRNEECSWGKCVCAKGCTGPDGTCHNHGDQLLMANFTLRVMAFPNDYLYTPRFPGFSTLRVTDKFASVYSTRFNLWKVPGRLLDGGLSDTYIIQPSEFPDYAVRVEGAEAKAVAINSWHIVPWPPRSVMLRVCRPVLHPEAVQILGGFGGATNSMYVHSGSWRVFAMKGGDPGPEGYWIPDKPLDASIETCPQR